MAEPKSNEAASQKGESPEERAQKAADEHDARGFIGEEVDPTPNERYSLESEDFRTPETDPKLAQEVGSTRFVGVETT